MMDPARSAPRDESPKTIYIGYYFLAFIDIVGQRDKLKQLTALPITDVEKERTEQILLETSEYVKELRDQFDTIYGAASKPTGLLDSLNSEQRKWVEQRKQSRMWRRGFSDSYFIVVPCLNESSWGSYSLDIWRSLVSICGLFIWALAKEKPFRGAVEVGLGTEISPGEVYGPVNVRVLELEAAAGYPRVVVGEGFKNHLDDLERRCGNNLEGRHTKQCVHLCR